MFKIRERYIFAMILILLMNVNLLANSFVYEFAESDFEKVDTESGVVYTLPDGELIEQANSPPLPIVYHNFFVKSGKVDSISLIKDNPYNIDEPALATTIDRITTFAGNDQRDEDFYQNRLLEYLENNDTYSTKITVLQSDERKVIQIALEPLEYKQSNNQLVGYGTIEIHFHGDEFLQVEILDDMINFEESINDSKDKSKNITLYNSALSDQVDYLVVTSQQLSDAFQPLLTWKRLKGLNAGIVTIEEIVAVTSGLDDAEKLRNYLIAAYSAGTEYVLLGGDEDILPVRYAFHANVNEAPDIELQQICDLYFADISGDWDVDGDGVYGEPSHDNPDLYPEILLGRLPFNTTDKIDNYIAKLIKYEQNPGNGDFQYLNNSLFVSADQMRDYSSGEGQHQLLANTLPEHVSADISAMVEAPSGSAEYPPTPLSGDAITTLSQGWGMITLLIHGACDAFVIRSNQYNQWPKNYIFTADEEDGTHGFLPNVQPSGKAGLIYSIGCNNGAFDMDKPPFPSVNPCIAERFLTSPDGGAVAFIGNSRWGWVSSSWKLERAFLDYLYNTDNNVARAQRYSKSYYSYYRDLNYGLNLYGDPDLNIWTDIPQYLSVVMPQNLTEGLIEVDITVRQGSELLTGAVVTILKDEEIIGQAITSSNGKATLQVDYNFDDQFEVVVYHQGALPTREILTPQIVLDVDDNTILPIEFTLHQNYPNPFNPVTEILFELDRPTRVTLEIFNILGQSVLNRKYDLLEVGSHRYEWDGTDNSGNQQPSGIYFTRVIAGNNSDIIKMTLLK